MAHFVNLCVSLKPETNILLAAVTMHKLVWDSGNLTTVLKWIPGKSGGWHKEWIHWLYVIEHGILPLWSSGYVSVGYRYGDRMEEYLV